MNLAGSTAKNIAIEARFAEERYDQLPKLAAELVQLKVDVIVAGDSPVISAAKKATTTIPIVMSDSGDPISSGHVTSLARPGGNITGLSNMTGPLVENDTVSQGGCAEPFSRGHSGPSGRPEWKELGTVSRAFGIQLQALAVRIR